LRSSASLRKIHIFGEKLQELGADIAKIPVDDEKELMKFKLRVV